MGATSLKRKPEVEKDTYFRVIDNPKWPEASCCYCTAPNAIHRNEWQSELEGESYRTCVVINEDGVFCTGLCYTRYVANVKYAPDRAKALRLAKIEFDRESYPYNDTGTAIGFGELAFKDVSEAEVRHMNEINLAIAAAKRETVEPIPGVMVVPLMAGYENGAWIESNTSKALNMDLPREVLEAKRYELYHESPACEHCEMVIFNVNECAALFVNRTGRFVLVHTNPRCDVDLVLAENLRRQVAA